MRTRVDVKDAQEASAIRVAMKDPETHALVVIVGALLPRTQRSRRRVMEFVKDQLDEERFAKILAR